MGGDGTVSSSPRKDPRGDATVLSVPGNSTTAGKLHTDMASVEKRPHVKQREANGEPRSAEAEGAGVAVKALALLSLSPAEGGGVPVKATSTPCANRDPSPKGEMGGLGLGLGVNMRDDQWAGIRVTELMPGSPAAEIGVIETGDELLEIDNERIDSLNFEGFAPLFCLFFFTGASSRDTRQQRPKVFTFYLMCLTRAILPS